MSAATAGGPITLILAGLGVLIASLWILMPFAIFGSKDLLRQLTREQRKTNELLKAQIDRPRALDSQ